MKPRLPETAIELAKAVKPERVNENQSHNPSEPMVCLFGSGQRRLGAGHFQRPQFDSGILLSFGTKKLRLHQIGESLAVRHLSVIVLPSYLGQALWHCRGSRRTNSTWEH